MFRICDVVAHRCEFPKLLTKFKVGVEIGVREADYATSLLRQWPGFMHLVDPWESYPEYIDDPQDHRHNYLRAMEKLAPFFRRYKVWMEKDSEDLAERIGPMDFAYIDGNHAFPYVAKDMRIWWDKLSPGGILAGHDLFQVQLPGVTEAVARFSIAVNRQVSIIRGFAGCPCGDGGHPSWYIRK